jgi:hypothetical protein
MDTKNIGLRRRRGRDPMNNPREGDTTIKEGNKFVFKNGSWVKASTDSRTHTRTGQGSTAGRTTPAAKPAAKPNSWNRTGNADVEQLRQAQNDAIKNHPGNKPKPSAPPKPSGSSSTPPAPTRGSGSTSSASKPTPKPAGKVPSSNAGMKNQDKNFRGNPDRKDSIASTLRELRGMGSGRKTNEANASKPEDKSRYVASNGKPYAGPAFGDSKSSTAKKEDKKMTLAERMRKRRQGLA